MMRPHDLLWLRQVPGDLPGWARVDWPVVVRRAAPMTPGRIPVGIRGDQRNQRHGAWIEPAQVMRVSTPEALAAEGLRALPQDRGLPCLEALGRLAPLLDAGRRPWGPTGGVGFALATGLAVLHAASDLDLLVRAETPLEADECRLLQSLKAHAGCRLDIQIDTGLGGFAFDEWAAGRRSVLLKTAHGPRLVRDPWHLEDEEAA